MNAFTSLFEIDFTENNVNNISQAGQAYVYGVMAEAGIPKGYCTDFSGIMQLDETLTDVCVLPSLSEATEEVKEKIRSLSNRGVALVAVSDVADIVFQFWNQDDVTSSSHTGMKGNPASLVSHYFDDHYSLV